MSRGTHHLKCMNPNWNCFRNMHHLRIFLKSRERKRIFSQPYLPRPVTVNIRFKLSITFSYSWSWFRLTRKKNNPTISARIPSRLTTQPTRRKRNGRKGQKTATTRSALKLHLGTFSHFSADSAVTWTPSSTVSQRRSSINQSIEQYVSDVTNVELHLHAKLGRNRFFLGY